MPKSFKLKLILGGASGSGKTSFLQNSPITRGDFFHIGVSFKPIECLANDGDSYKFLVWDLKGSKRFRVLFPLFCRGACAAILCFDRTNRETFDDLPNWINIIRKSAGNIPIFLIGTKSDLNDRKVSEEEVLFLMKNYNIIDVFYTSIYENDQKGKIFRHIVENIDPEYPLENFTLFVPEELEKDKKFKNFLEFFSKCPICHRNNHFESLRRFYFSRDPSLIMLRDKLFNLIEESKYFDDVYYNKIKLGIPCCTCYKTIFKENF
ncbi:MAG: Rab family GTPase [Promethearchaeota archaeon]